MTSSYKFGKGRQDMNNELLARAISEIDDDLLEEARQPFPKKRNTFAVFSRYMAAAACFLLIFATVLMWFEENNRFTVDINGADLLTAEASENPIEIPLAAAMQRQKAAGIEIPLHLSGGKQKTVLTADAGGVLIDSNGEGHTELIVSGNAEIGWLVDVTVQESFELTMRRENRTMRLTAIVSSDKNTLMIAASYD